VLDGRGNKLEAMVSGGWATPPGHCTSPGWTVASMLQQGRVFALGSPDEHDGTRGSRVMILDQRAVDRPRHQRL
jgi:hypothetical protein